jgi:hypothetical protein
MPALGRLERQALGAAKYGDHGYPQDAPAGGPICWSHRVADNTHPSAIHSEGAAYENNRLVQHDYRTRGHHRLGASSRRSCPCPRRGQCGAGGSREPVGVSRVGHLPTEASR